MPKISAYTEQPDPNNDDYFVMVRASTTFKMKRATVLEFTPTTPGDWGSPTPTSIQQALDTLAASIGASLPPDADYGDIVITAGVWRLDSSIDFTGKQLNHGTWDDAVIQNSVLTSTNVGPTNPIEAKDSIFYLKDDGDLTKIAQFQCSGIATATTRTFTFPDASGTIALTSDLSSGYQPLDSDLTTIAGLTATTDNFIQSKSSAWASRTVAQVSADLQATGLVTDAVGFRTIPQNSQSAAYTTVAADSGKHILHPAADTNARTFTIDSNANVAYPVGTAITFVNETSQVVTIAITSDTLTLAGTTTTGSRSLAQNGVATALKITSTKWVISGTGLT